MDNYNYCPGAYDSYGSDRSTRARIVAYPASSGYLQRMIEGLGLDIVDISRIARAFDRHGDRFTRRLLGPKEIQRKILVQNTVSFLAGRWAAKEATIKALAELSDIRPHLQEIEILPNSHGAPTLHLHGRFQDLLNDRISRVSISHSGTAATAVVLIERLVRHGK